MFDVVSGTMGGGCLPKTRQLFLNGAAVEPMRDLNNCNMMADCMVYTSSACYTTLLRIDVDFTASNF